MKKPPRRAATKKSPAARKAARAPKADRTPNKAARTGNAQRVRSANAAVPRVARSTDAAAGTGPAPNAPLSLPPSLDIQHVREVAALLRERMGTASPMRIDASGVAHADTAGLQLLLVARLSAQSRGLRFEWRGISAALRATAATLGLTLTLGLP